MTSLGSAGESLIAPSLRRAAEHPERAEIAERVKILFLQLLAGEITADEFDEKVSPKEFGLATISWGFKSDLYKQAMPHMDRRKAKADNLRELREFAESKAGASQAANDDDIWDE